MQIINLNYKERLFDITVTLPEKGLVGVIGENGAGKSTFLKCIAGVLAPTVGNIIFNDKLISSLSVKEKSEYISYLKQNPPVLWNIDVDSLISLGLINKKIPPSQVSDKLECISSCFNLANLRKKSVYEISGGELARAHLARAAIAETPILLVDEPIASLDPFYKIEIMDYLQKLSKDRLIILVVHDLMLASEFCDYFVILKKGRLTGKGSRSDVINKNVILESFSVLAEIDENYRIVKINKY